MKPSSNPRVEELLVERALRPLDDQESTELEQLGGAHDDTFDLAAAALVVATTVSEPMPAALADKILAAAPGGTGPVDFKRTLPGVAMPADLLPRDTMVGVDLGELAEAAARTRTPTTQPRAQPAPPASTPLALAPTVPPIVPATPTLPDGLPSVARATAADALAPTVPPAGTATLPPPVARRTPAIAAPSLIDPIAPTLQPEVDAHLKGTGLLAQARTTAPGSVPAVGRTPSGQGLQRALSPNMLTNVVTPLIGGPTLVDPREVQPPTNVASPELRTPLPQESTPFSVEAPPLSVPYSRDQVLSPPIAQPFASAPSSGLVDELAARRAPIAAPIPQPRRVVLPWLAAAACLVIAGGAVWWALQQHGPEGTGGAQPVAIDKPAPAAARAALIANAKDVATIAWTATQDPTAHGASGDVVWSPAEQRGYMRFVGLAANDPAQFQYQLWIFDKARDQAFPVDGGVFDVGPSGEVVVAINPKLRVNDLAMFAVTVEKPGGVVVSKRERIVVTATRS